MRIREAPAAVILQGVISHGLHQPGGISVLGGFITMKIFVVACFGTFILIMGLELLAGLISAIAGRGKEDQDQKEKDPKKIIDRRMK